MRTVVLVPARGPLDRDVATAFSEIRTQARPEATLVFDLGWQPTIELVEVVAAEIEKTPFLRELFLVHSSAAMAVIAGAIDARCIATSVVAKRSLFDDPDDEFVEPTELKTVFQMRPEETIEGFVRAALKQVRVQAIHRFALVFDTQTEPTLAIADVLVEELIDSKVNEIGLVHGTADLGPIASSIRLRLGGVTVGIGSTRKASDR
jgi:hypothetical protein